VPQLEPWLALLGSILSSDASDVGLRTSAVRACTSLMRAIPKKCSKYMPLVLGPVWALLVSGATVYSQTILDGSDAPADEADEDGGNFLTSKML
jgi:hypothetical protein